MAESNIWILIGNEIYLISKKTFANTMKHVSILVPHGPYSIVNIAGSFQILNWAHEMYMQEARQPLFEVELVGLQASALESQGLYQVMPMKTIEQVKQTDLIIIPAVHTNQAEALAMNQEAIPWLINQHTQGADIAAYCIGTFLLAQTGLLKGRACSTHWGQAEELQAMFPDVQVQSEKIITESEGLYTSGGAYAFTNLLIYLIEKYGGRELAIMTAKAFMIDLDKNDQSLFMVFQGQKNHQDAMVLAVQQFLESQYAQNISVDDLAREQATNRRTLERRFRAATGNTVIQYLQRVRVESAKKMLEQDKHNVSDAMYAVGYHDAKSFREVFRKYVGASPMEYKKKFLGAVSLRG